MNLFTFNHHFFVILDVNNVNYTLVIYIVQNVCQILFFRQVYVSAKKAIIYILLF